jgi:succinate-semialdehyde dehydrogenase/glutarate-semialdehyde dehydrogenase
MATHHQLFINGAWRDGGAGPDLPLFNPATEREIGRVAQATPADLDDALGAAEASLDGWSTTAAHERGRRLLAAADILKGRIETAAHALSQEQGKTVDEARHEFARAIETLVWNGEQAQALSSPIAIDAARSINPQALGVVAAFTPWNYPAVITARKLAPALAAGCPVILKAAEETPSAAVAIVEALADAGVPAGVVNLVFGVPAQISSHLLASPIVRALSFTGSTVVGKHLAAMAAANLQRCVLELGGHCPALVFADADLDEAARWICDYKFECAGQSCNAPSHVLVEAPVHDALVDKVVAISRAIRIGSGDDPATQMGPMANIRRIREMERLTRDAVDRGARLATGGQRSPREGWFWPPTILTHLDPRSLVLHEEPFGPILPISSFTDVDEAIGRANGTVYGLAAYVFTASAATKTLLTRRLAAGSVSVNRMKGVSADAPNGGLKDSGYGYEGGVEGLRTFQNLKLVNGGAPATPGRGMAG